MIELNADALLTAGGVALFVALATQALVKPALKKFKESRWYKLALNVIAILLGISGAVLAQAAIGPLEFASVFDAVLVGFSGASVAVLGYEGVKNAKSYLGSE